MSIARVKASSLTQGLPKKKDILAGNDPIYAGSYESIQTVTVGAGGQATISFTSIPTTYKHLQLRYIAAGTSTPVVYLRLNSDSGANYVRHRLQGTGAAAQSSANTGETAVYMFGSAGLPTSSTFGASVLDILDSSNTNKYKTIRALDGVDTNGAGTIEFMSSLWMSTAAITAITLTLSAGNFSQYSSFALYGIN